MWVPPDLRGKVCVVAGATRGAGRGIATALGEAGATVYCTGRTTRERASPMARKETIEETADRVTRAGGRGIAVRVDHLEETQVRALFDRVRQEEGRLDVLVNDIWGGEALTEWGQKFWEMDVQKGLEMMRTALHTHIITARHGAPLLVERPGGLIVEVTDGDHGMYRGSLFYDLVKDAIIRLAFDMDVELREKACYAVAVTPGFLRSEQMLDHFGVTEATWREGAKKDPHFLQSETPLFVGRAVAHLAADPERARKAGRVWASWTLSDEYGFPDAAGEHPHWGRHWEKAFGRTPTLDEGFYRYWGDRSLLQLVQQTDYSSSSATL